MKRDIVIPTARGTVVVVDDESKVRESLESLIKSAGFGVRAFSSANEALQSNIFASASCLVTDVRMADVDGFELLRRVKRDLPDLPVIFITAHYSKEIVKQAQSEGAASVFRKPFDPDDLLSTVERLLTWK